ncbi:MAG: SIMPL domain-containing protein [Chloroflexi bacterium]|nr:SIMPL domain-containing protein [Chloroflexota bacterium]
MNSRIMLALTGLIVAITVAIIAYGTAPQRTTQSAEASGLNAPNNQTAIVDTSGISVLGTGKVHVKPNIATTNIGVETVATTLAEATSQSNTKTQAIIDKVKSMGVAERDIQTSAYGVSPITNQPKQGESPKITGYRVSNQLRVTIRKIDDVGKILDAVVAAGANNIYGISFGVDDPTTFQQQARAAAIKDAQDKAGQLAKAAGITLGKVISINEGSTAPIPLMRDSIGAATLAAPDVPIATGEMDISITVEMRFAVQ